VALNFQHLATVGKLPTAGITSTANEMLFRQILAETAMARFRWQGFPDEVDTRMIEWNLVMRGTVGVTESPLGVVAGAVNYGGCDFYGNPTQATVVGETGIMEVEGQFVGVIQFDRPIDEVAVGYDSPMRANLTMQIIDLYAQRLASIQQTIDSLLVTMRHPIIITGPQTMKAAITSVLKALKGGEPLIAGYTEGMENIEAKALPILPNSGGDRYVETAYQALRTTQEECMRALGIPVIDGTKRERMITSEVERQSAESAINARRFMGARERLAEDINRKLGLSVEVIDVCDEVAEQARQDQMQMDMQAQQAMRGGDKDAD